VQLQKRDQRQLQRHHQQADDRRDQQRAAGKPIQASA
jgi:hypothetical protein